MNEALDFRSYFVQKDVNARIKESRDDLLHIMQSEHKRLEEKMDSEHKRLESKIDNLEKRMDGLEARMDRMETRIDFIANQIVSMKFWGIGLLITVLLAIAALAVPVYISVFGAAN